MGYNYGSECKKFHAKWDRLTPEYAAAGMSEEAIQEMRDFDWEELKRERIFQIHNQSLESAFPDSDVASEDNSPLLHSQLERLSVRQPEISDWGRYDWIEDIDTTALAKQVKSLSAADNELLSCMVVDGLNRAEIARERDISRAAVTKRLNRIGNCLEKSRDRG